MLHNPWLIHLALGFFFSYGAVQIFVNSKVTASFGAIFGAVFLLSSAHYASLN